MSGAHNATAAALLGLLHEGPMSGWDLVATAQQRFGEFWTLTQSQVYRELARMAENGLVVAGDKGRRDRRPYAITDAGRAAFAERVTAEPAREQVRVPLLLVIQFAEHIPEQRLRELIAVAGHFAITAGQRATAAPGPPRPAGTAAPRS